LPYAALFRSRGRVRIQAAGQPGRGDLQARTRDALRIVGLDQGVVVGQEEEALHPGRARGGDGGTDGTGIVAQVRGAGGGDAGEYANGHGARSRGNVPILPCPALATRAPFLPGKRTGKSPGRRLAVARAWVTTA